MKDIRKTKDIDWDKINLMNVDFENYYWSRKMIACLKVKSFLEGCQVVKTLIKNKPMAKRVCAQRC